MDHGQELVLARMATMMKHEGPLRIQDPKAWLRSQGQIGKKAATMLGSLSTNRNTQAHPRVFRLLQSLELLGQASQGTEARECEKDAVKEASEPADRLREHAAVESGVDGGPVEAGKGIGKSITVGRTAAVQVQEGKCKGKSWVDCRLRLSVALR